MMQDVAVKGKLGEEHMGFLYYFLYLRGNPKLYQKVKETKLTTTKKKKNGVGSIWPVEFKEQRGGG